jgi:lipopolysaccharide biosynthesis regulator YciM
MLNRILFGILVVCTAISCTENPETIINKEEIRPFIDEEKFIQKSGIEKVNKDIIFWTSRLEENETPVYKVKLASVYQSKFGITKDVSYLAKAEDLLLESNNFYKEQNAGVLQALAQLSITKHDFRSALEYAEKALLVGEDKLLSHMIIYDASMETGDFEHASYILENEITNKSSFNYLIRKSQFEDYSGNASESISALEKGAERIDYSESLSSWTHSNLGDRLGHEGNVPKSYEMFLKVLKKKRSGASYLHSLKGIAYIAYAHDGDTDFAKEILDFVHSNQESPDALLMYAEIAEYESDDSLKREYLNEFYTKASDSKYYGMYDAELIQLAATEFGDFEVAEALIQKELENRPSPITYDLQAWVKFHKGEIEEARSILEDKVLGKTYEPVPAYHAGVILREAGEAEKAKELLKYAKEASFELGPVTVRDIDSKLN